MAASPQISEQEWAVWRRFYAMRRQLDRALEQQLQGDSGISGPDYEILVALFDAPDRKLRARELAEIIGWEKSRISHQVSRMETRGLVERTECETDLRGTWIGMTNEGKRTIFRAMRNHHDAIRRFFFDVLTDEEKELVSAASGKVLDAINPAACEVAESIEARRA
ncbi:MarR family winged helix-turn-helix transcriptional regulator [Cryobacterium sp. BB307]|uniref:MarR family winged helix-turn-helix transcriptional regulator n=1 Tax=Cryobacterium sp. BB307 TaxID=2716317 RepID=UPI00144730BA|nr:MarR family winged helix-turn-helix transcriptional regulator [Cryobacterium sp. BB307]